MKTYQEHLKAHLARYKSEVLGVTESGIARQQQRPYDHLLPESLSLLNILSPYRDAFDAYLDEHAEISLHGGFHHLNSSQAMCFNLFFGFFTGPERDQLILLEALRLPATVVDWAFEKVLQDNEQTNFDFYIDHGDAGQTCFELKLSENNFGTCADDERHRAKLAEIYRPGLEGWLPENFLSPPFFFANYQIMRNVFYADADLPRRIVFLHPHANEQLRSSEPLIRDLSDRADDGLIRSIYLEDLCDTLAERETDLSATAREALSEFRTKYLPAELAAPSRT
jgi:hypothetical protein